DSISTNYPSLQRRLPGCPQGVDTSETALCKLLIAGWVTDVKPGEDSIADVRHRHLGSPTVEDWIVVSTTLQHPVDHTATDVVRIVSKLGLAGCVHQQQTESVRLRPTDGEQRADAGTRLELLARPGKFLSRALRGALEDGAVELFLRGEVPIDNFLRDTGSRGHLLHRRAGKPFRRKGGRSTLENCCVALRPRQELTGSVSHTASCAWTLHLSFLQCRLERQQRKAKNCT